MQRKEHWPVDTGNMHRELAQVPRLPAQVLPFLHPGVSGAGARKDLERLHTVCTPSLLLLPIPQIKTTPYTDTTTHTSVHSRFCKVSVVEAPDRKAAEIRGIITALTIDHMLNGP